MEQPAFVFYSIYVGNLWRVLNRRGNCAVFKVIPLATEGTVTQSPVGERG